MFTNKKLVTLTAVRPTARFGALKLKGKHVSYFKEKSKLDEGWINGGFFVMEPDFLNFIKNDNTYLEREPLEKATKKKQLTAFKHKGFNLNLLIVYPNIICSTRKIYKRNRINKSIGYEYHYNKNQRFYKKFEHLIPKNHTVRILKEWGHKVDS